MMMKNKAGNSKHTSGNKVRELAKPPLLRNLLLTCTVVHFKIPLDAIHRVHRFLHPSKHFWNSHCGMAVKAVVVLF
jgi:hypothetical protein